MTEDTEWIGGVRKEDLARIEGGEFDVLGGLSGRTLTFDNDSTKILIRERNNFGLVHVEIEGGFIKLDLETVEAETDERHPDLYAKQLVLECVRIFSKTKPKYPRFKSIMAYHRTDDEFV